MTGARLLRGLRRRGPGATVLAAVAAATLVVGVPSAGAAGGGARVTVVDGSDGATSKQDLTTAEIAAIEDVVGTTYTTVSPRGESKSSYSGTTVAAVAGLAGVTPANVASVDITAPTAPGQAISFTGEQVRDGFLEDPAAAGQPRYGLFRARSSGSGDIAILRPYLPARPGTPASSDELTPAAGEPIDVTIGTVDGVVGVDIEASTTRPDVREQVQLTARPTAGSSDVRSVAWSFGDGQTASTAATTHAYAAAGTYTARATIETEDGKSGVASVTVVVGTPAQEPPATTDDAVAPGGAGPGGASGGRTGGADNPATGPSASSTTVSPGPSPSASGQAAESATPAARPRRESRSQERAGAARTPGRQTRTATPNSPAPQATPDAATPSARRDEGESAKGRERRRSGTRPSAGDGGTISGVLVASRTAAVIPISPAEVARAAAARRGAEPKGTSDLAWVLGPLVVVGLLGAGAVRELRPLRRPLTATRMPTT